MIAKDMKIREMITMMADTPVEEITRLFTEDRIGGLPLVGDKNQVIGIVKRNHLFLKEKGMPFSFLRITRLFQRCGDSVWFMAKPNTKRVPKLRVNMLARGKSCS